MIPPPGFLARLTVLLALLALAAVATTERVVRPWAVRGPSMTPTLRDGDRVLVDVWTYRYRLPRPGEVVVLDAPPPVDEPVVKRVRGLTTTPRGAPAVWVVGDARDRSVDSRTFGAVAATRVRGRVLLRYWPPSGFGRIGPAPSTSPPGPDGAATLPGR